MADQLNFQLPATGFGSYLDGILPDDIATSAGAFSASMQQIKNILSIDFEKFAQVAYSIEVVNRGLPLVNGTDVPVNLPEAELAYDNLALGSGPYGTYTLSDFFGCMSGLPYQWQGIQNGILSIQTQTLQNIYKNLYLAVTWEEATATWDGTSFTYTNRGGGYGRGAGAPNVTVNGNSATATIGTNPDDLSTYGRIISISYSGSAGTVVIAPPPDDGTGGWPGMDTVVQTYITAANNEIANIRSSNPQAASRLNQLYNAAGSQLKLEQRSRFLGLSPVSIPRDDFTNQYPMAISVFVDSIPALAQDTRPHMAAQTLEAISNLDTVGGQSIVALMRHERNAVRIRELGISLDDNIPGEYDSETLKNLIANNTVPYGIEGIESPECNTTYTIPSNLFVKNDMQEVITVKPYGYYNDDMYESNMSEPGQLPTLQQIYNHDCANPFVSAGPSLPISQGVLIDTGKSVSPGSLAGSRAVNLIPPNLNTAYTSSTLTPSTLSVQEAIDDVIRCNCDCWID